jgi:ABC-type lipoprotein export system ATPase subunit
MVYDIEYTTDKIITYYKNKYMINKMQFRLDYLNKFIPQNIYINSYFEKIKTIIIEPFINNLPLLINKNKLIINENEHILLSGASGSGKTSLLYLLKGIIKINNLTIFPPIDIINNQSYLTLSNYKSIYNGNLYDIITNFNLNPNIDLINYLLEKSKINNKLNKNIFININELSSGEKLRLLITKIMYTIKTNNYNILLFDEIDNNLNDELAIDIYKNIDEIFNDKIILYITHNEKVKKLFKKKIIIENGIIY